MTKDKSDGRHPQFDGQPNFRQILEIKSQEGIELKTPIGDEMNPLNAPSEKQHQENFLNEIGETDTVVRVFLKDTQERVDDTSLQLKINKDPLSDDK